MRLPATMKKAMVQGKQCCADVAGRMALLTRLAATAPQYQDQVNELRDIVEHLDALCECGLTFERESEKR